MTRIREITTPALLAGAAALAVVHAPIAYADSVTNMSDATGDSLEASSRIVVSGGQVALGAVAIPLALAGEVTGSAGDVATETSDVLWQAANAPLTVDPAVAMAQPAPNVPRDTETVEPQP